jgi:hypothetical protein
MEMTQQEVAVAAVERAAVEGYVRAFLAVMDALDARMGELSRIDRNDYALAAWDQLVDNPDIAYTPQDVVVLITRAAAHVPDGIVVNLIDARFGDSPREIRADNGTGLDWDPEHRRVTLYSLHLGQVVETTFGRRR